MVLSDIQPHYFPRQHFFARMLSSDAFVVRDDVQYVKKHKFPDGKTGVSHQADSPIKTPNGIFYLTINVKKGASYSPISETLVSYDQGWVVKHLNSIRQCYSKAPYFDEIFPGITALLESQADTVADLNTATMCFALGYMLEGNILAPENCTLQTINDSLQQQSSVSLKKIAMGSVIAGSLFEDTGSASERVVKLCQWADAGVYVTGGTAREAYLDVQLLEDNKITLQVQDWQCEEYPQLYNKNNGFITNLSILDLMMNVERNQALAHLGVPA